MDRGTGYLESDVLETGPHSSLDESTGIADTQLVADNQSRIGPRSKTQKVVVYPSRRRCAAANCKQTAPNLFEFPNPQKQNLSDVEREKVAELRSLWIDFVRVGRGSDWEPVPASRLCYRHFTEDCFTNQQKYKIGFAQSLKRKIWAVPTIHSPVDTTSVDCVEEEPSDHEGLEDEEAGYWGNNAVKVEPPDEELCDQDSFGISPSDIVKKEPCDFSRTVTATDSESIHEGNFYLDQSMETPADGPRILNRIKVEPREQEFDNDMKFENEINEAAVQYSDGLGCNGMNLDEHEMKTEPNTDSFSQLAGGVGAVGSGSGFGAHLAEVGLENISTDEADSIKQELERDSDANVRRGLLKIEVEDPLHPVPVGLKRKIDNSCSSAMQSKAQRVEMHPQPVEIQPKPVEITPMPVVVPGCGLPQGAVLSTISSSECGVTGTGFTVPPDPVVVVPILEEFQTYYPVLEEFQTHPVLEEFQPYCPVSEEFQTYSPVLEEFQPYYPVSEEFQTYYPILSTPIENLRIRIKRITRKTEQFVCKLCQRSFQTASSLRGHQRVHSPRKKKNFPRKKKNPKNFKCNECGKAYSYHRSLNEHMNKHTGMTGKRKFKCDVCDRSYVHHSGLRIHMLTAHVHEKPFRCEECDKSFKEMGTYKLHELQHHQPEADRPFKCNVCKKRFTRSAHLKIHKVVHKKPLKCNLCGKKFQRASGLSRHKVVHLGKSLQEHRNTHFEDRLYKCHQCDKAFKHNSSLSSHNSLCHAKEKPFKCDECDAAFKLASQLKKHQINQGTDRPFECQLCSSTFKHKCGLNNHMKNHSEERPFDCDICGKACKRKSDLISHLVVHSEERPFKCDECDETFKRKKVLKAHQRDSHSIGCFSCDECGRAFKRKKDLKDHLVVHSEERPFKCDECDKSFKRKSGLKSHQHASHSGICFSCDECGKAFKRKRNLEAHVQQLHR